MMKQEEKIMDKNIKKTLQKLHPDATKISKDRFGNWDVLIEYDPEGYFEETITYKLEGSKLRYIGTVSCDAS